MADINQIKVNNEIYDVRDNHGLFEKMIIWDGNVDEDMDWISTNGFLMSMDGTRIPGVFYRYSDYFEMNNNQYLIGCAPELTSRYTIESLLNNNLEALITLGLFYNPKFSPSNFIESAYNLQAESEFGKLMLSVLGNQIGDEITSELIGLAEEGVQIGLNFMQECILYINTPKDITLSPELSYGMFGVEEGQQITIKRGLWLFKGEISMQIDEVPLPIQIYPYDLYLLSIERSKTLDSGIKSFAPLFTLLQQGSANNE